jgi:hypothetical protein
MNASLDVAYMSHSSHLVRYDPRSQFAPVAILCMEIVHDIKIIEVALLLARNPRQVHDDVIMELHCLISRIMFLRYLSLLPLHHRATHLMNRAQVKLYNQCLVLTRRCAELADICQYNYGGDSGLPSYADLVDAVIAVDDVLQYMDPALKQFYVVDVRPILVRYMADDVTAYSGSGSDFSGSASCSFVAANASSGDEFSEAEHDFAHVFASALPAAKRVCWTTACTAFEYVRTAADAEAAYSGSDSDFSDSAACSFVSANASSSDEFSEAEHDFAHVFLSALPATQRVCGSLNVNSVL